MPTRSRTWHGASRSSSPTPRAARGSGPATCSARAPAAAAACSSCGGAAAATVCRRSAPARRCRSARGGDRNAREPHRRRQRAVPLPPARGGRAARANERRVAYKQGLHELGDGLCAYLQPDGSWGLSNAGLVSAAGRIAAGRHALRPARTAAMLETMAPRLAASPIGAAFNTHGERDHCFGNQMLRPASRSTRRTLRARRCAEAIGGGGATGLGGGDLDPSFAAFARERFGPFDFQGIELRRPMHRSTGAGAACGRPRRGADRAWPGAQRGDAIAHVRMPASVFTGDSSSSAGRPSSGRARSPMAGARATQFSAGARTMSRARAPGRCRRGARRPALPATRESRGSARFAAGMTADEASDDIELGEFADLGDPERIVVNVETVYRELDPSRPRIPYRRCSCAWRTGRPPLRAGPEFESVWPRLDAKMPRCRRVPTASPATAAAKPGVV